MGWKPLDPQSVPEGYDIAFVDIPAYRELIWTDEAKGFGFPLRSSRDVNLIAVTESVEIGPELKPIFSDDTKKALEQLRDSQITALPVGMVEDGVIGAPPENAADRYSHVRRRYFTPKTNQNIYFEYESYVTDCSNTEDVLHMPIGTGENPFQMKTIHGCTYTMVHPPL